MGSAATCAVSLEVSSAAPVDGEDDNEGAAPGAALMAGASSEETAASPPPQAARIVASAPARATDRTWLFMSGSVRAGAR